MGRKIVLLSDGTGNSAAKVWRTNVWRVFESLDLSGDDQIGFYDDGVGTASFKPLAILGGGFGLGLGRNVVDIYKFSCRNYRSDDDEIFGFGFSRGAFTIRVVVGLILEQGLIDASSMSESELHSNARAAYRAYRANNFHTKWPRWLRPEDWARGLRNLILRSNYSADANRKDVNIRFLGLWDTVAAYGMPVEEMARGISEWLWPWMLPNCVLHRSVQRACQALSIDEDRTTFHPVLWDESAEAPLVANSNGQRFLSNERISQVWFAGPHANVGGGYPDDSLAQIPLVWIEAEASKCSLRFKTAVAANPQTEGHAVTAQDKDGRMYEPRQGLGSYYRYGPRDIWALGEKLLSRRGGTPLPRIHESIFARIRNRAHAYAPVGLPADYEVVTTAGEVLTAQQANCELPAQAQARWNAQQRVWTTVWWRRIAYFGALAITIYLIAFPMWDDGVATDEHTTALRWLSDIIQAVGNSLPNAAAQWKDGYARAPGEFSVVVILLILALSSSSNLASKIQDGMERLWRGSFASTLTNPGLPSDMAYRIRTHPLSLKIYEAIQTTLAPAFFALVFAYLGAVFLSHLAFNVWDDGGLICKGADKPGELAKGDFLLANGTDTLSSPDYQNITEHDQNSLLKYLVGRGVKLPTFAANNPCQSLKINVSHLSKYLLQFDSAPSASRPWTSTIGLLPLRRDLFQTPHQIVVRYGLTGGDETFLVADPTDPASPIDTVITPTSDGELFIYLNDPVIGVPCTSYWCPYGAFYRYNTGTTRVLVAQKPFPWE